MKVGIVGLGLIGGSLGLDLRQQGYQVLGVSRSWATCQIALNKGAVDQADTNLNLLAAAEVVIVCTPIKAIAPTIQQLIPYLDPNTIITDVGSVKQPIVAACSSLWSNFVGGHPMAGTAEQGINAAQPHLFAGAAYVFTPIPTTSTTALAKLKQIAQSLGATPYICEPEVHDRAVAWISHLPVMVSANLIKSCLTESEALNLAQQLASSGFRDTSRVGGGNPQLGVMMAKYNRQQLLRTLNLYHRNLEQIIELIEQENWQELEQILKLTQQARPDFLS